MLFWGDGELSGSHIVCFGKKCFNLRVKVLDKGQILLVISGRQFPNFKSLFLLFFFCFTVEGIISNLPTWLTLNDLIGASSNP